MSGLTATQVNSNTVVLQPVVNSPLSLVAAALDAAALADLTVALADDVSAAQVATAADLAAVQALLAALPAGTVVYGTKADMDAVTPTPPAAAYVLADATPANNGLYGYPTGASAWIKDASDLNDRLIALAADLAALTAADIAETATLKIMTADERTKLAGIETGAQVNTVTQDDLSDFRLSWPIDLGNPALIVSPGVANGALFNANSNTITIPAGSSGQNTSTLTRWILNGGEAVGASAAGRVYRIRIVFELSDPFTRTWAAALFQVRVGGSNITRAATASIETDGNRRIYQYDYTLQGDETEIRPTVSINSASNAATDETIRFADYRAYVLSAEALEDTPFDLVNRVRADAIINDAALSSLVRPSDPIADGSLVVAFGAANGATFNADARRLTIPEGVTGNNSSTLTRLILNGGQVVQSTRTGETVRIRLDFLQSDTFTRTWAVPNFQVRTGPSIGGSNVNRSVTPRITQTGSRRVYEYDYTLLGDESEIRPSVNVTGAVVTTVEETVTLADYSARIIGSPDPAVTPAELAFNERTKEYVGAPRILRFATDLKADTWDETITVAPSGGDYDDPNDAIAAANALSPSATNRIRIDIQPGTYDIDAEMQPGDYVDLIGRGAWRTLIRFFRDDSATGAQIDTDSTLRMQRNNRIDGLGIHGRNVRYAIHPEIPLVGGAFPNPIWEIINCDIRHFGNPSPNNTRPGAGQNAIGSGTNPGQVFRIIGSYCWAELGSAIAIHDNVDYAEPCFVEIGGNTMFAGSDSGRAISWATFGSGRADRLIYYGNAITGLVTLGNINSAAVQGTQMTAWGNTPHIITNAVDDYRPRVTDEERLLANGSASAIPRKSVLAFDGSADAVRVMTSADPASLFAGVAIEEIPANSMGRVKVKGWMWIDDVLRSDSGALTFGATMSVGGTAGTVSSGGSQGILRAVRTDGVLIS